MRAFQRLQPALAVVYLLGGLPTFVYLTFFDGYKYTAWNWIVAIPANFVLSWLWPLYWAILRPLMG